MREPARFLAVVGLSLAPVACGGAAQPTPQNPSPVAVGSDPVAAIATDSTAHLAPAPEPADVVVVARWRSPAKVLDTFQQWVGLPIPIEEAIDDIFRVRGMTNVVSMDAPVEFLVALDPKATDRDPKPFIGFSVGMRSLSDARRVFEDKREVREVQQGVYQVELGSRYERMNCFLGASLGASPARLVCGPRTRDAEALSAYMMRGLPVVAMPDNDLHGEVRLGPVQQRYGSMLPSALQMGASVVSHEIGTGDRNLDRAITDAVSGLSDEVLALSNDLEGLSIDVAIDPGARSMSGDMTLRFKRQSSWLAQRMFDNAAKAGAPPPLFWRLPADSDSAFFDRGMDGKNTEGIRRVGSNLIDAALAREGFSAGDRKAITDLFKRLLDSSPASVSAAGHIDPGSQPGAGGATEFDKIRDGVSASLGWNLVGLEEGPQRVDGWLRDLAAVYNRPGIKGWIRKESNLDARSMPQVSYRPRTVAGLTGLKALEVTVPASAFDRSIKGAAPKPFQYFVMLVPDGARTWVAMGADAKVIEDHLKVVKAGGGKTIEGKAGLEQLKSARAVTGGYLTMAGFAAQATGGLSQALGGRGYRNRDFEEVLNALARIPNHGQTPMIMISTATPGSTAAVSVKLHISRGTIDDLRSLAMQLGGHRSKP